MKHAILLLVVMAVIPDPAFAKNRSVNTQPSTAELCANPQLAKKKGLDCKSTGTTKRETTPAKPRLGFEFNPFGFGLN